MRRDRCSCRHSSWNPHKCPGCCRRPSHTTWCSCSPLSGRQPTSLLWCRHQTCWTRGRTCQRPRKRRCSSAQWPRGTSQNLSGRCRSSCQLVTSHDPGLGHHRNRHHPQQMEEPATTPQLLSNRPLYNQVAYGGLYKGAKSVSLDLKALEPNLQDLDSLAFGRLA